MWIALSLIILTFVIIGIVLGNLEKKKKLGNAKEEVVDKIKSVTVLGTRTGEQTKILGTYNFTIYSFLVEYESGKREAVECEANSAQFKELIMYVKTDNSENK